MQNVLVNLKVMIDRSLIEYIVNYLYPKTTASVDKDLLNVINKL